MSVENLKIVYEKATQEDVRTALDAYFRYNRLVRDIARKHGFETRTGAAVFAALSPNSDYHGNLRDTDRLLQAAGEGRPIESFTVSTYGANKKKAWAIAKGGDPFELIIAKKTRNFFLSIDDPHHPSAVCIDGHMYNCWRNERKHLVGLKRSQREYDIIADGVRTLATEAKVIASQMQSIIWITWRRIHGIKTPPQREFWEQDYRVAGLGWQPSFAVYKNQLEFIDG